MKDILARRALRQKWFVKPDNKSLWDKLKDYITFAIAVAAFIVSALSLYVGHYGGPQDLRVTVHLPQATVRATDLDLDDPDVAFSDKDLKGNDVSAEKAKSFELAVNGDMVFLNSGANPVLVSYVKLLTPTVRKYGAECENFNSYGSVAWSNPSFAIAPGELKPVKVSFDHQWAQRAPKVACFRFSVFDRAGNEVVTTFPGI